MGSRGEGQEVAKKKGWRWRTAAADAQKYSGPRRVDENTKDSSCEGKAFGSWVIAIENKTSFFFGRMT